MNKTEERINKMLKKSEPILQAGCDDIKTPPFTDGLKEIIEATEKHKEKCDKISTNVNKWGRKICDVDDDLDDMENGRCVWDADVYLDALDKKELTNEEWFCSLSTEEKAKFLHDIQFSCNTCTLTSFRLYKSNIMKCPLQVSCDKENGVMDEVNRRAKEKLERALKDAT